MNLSIVIPLLNEQNSIDELTSSISTVVKALRLEFEIILIDDGSTDNSWKIISEICSNNQNVRGIRFLKNFGKSQALSAGFKACNGDVVITMDADLQDDPNEIPELYKKVKEEKFDLVSGWKKVRYDSIIFKNFPSKIFNWAARITSGIKLNDFNCGIKAYKKEVIKQIKLTGGMHRYIPVLAKNAGYNRITEKIVIHHPRKHGKTKYGIDRFIKGFLDLITLWFIHKFGKRPMHLFGSLGIFVFIIGFSFLIYIGIDKIFLDKGAKLIANRTEFYIALTLIIIGVQFFLAGFLGEMLSRNSPNRNQYQIREKLNVND